MRTFTSLAVFTQLILASVRCFDAGVMPSETPSAIASAPLMDGYTPSLVADWMAGRSEQRQSVWKGESSDISVIASQTVGRSAVVWELEILVSHPFPSNWLAFANATLPPNPVFDVLLTPS